MIELFKDGQKKIVDPESPLLPKLKESGWLEEESADDDLAQLKEEARSLGLSFHPRTGAEKLEAMIAQAKASA